MDLRLDWPSAMDHFRFCPLGIPHPAHPYEPSFPDQTVQRCVHFKSKKCDPQWAASLRQGALQTGVLEVDMIRSFPERLEDTLLRAGYAVGSAEVLETMESGFGLMASVHWDADGSVAVSGVKRRLMMS